MTATYIQDLCEALLDEALDGLALARTGHAPPARTFVSHGEPVADFDTCDDGLLAVWHGPIGYVQTNRQIRPQTTFYVDVHRCVPTMADDGAPPTPAEMTESADYLNRDLWSLLTYLYDRASLVFEGCGPITWGPATALGPEGGIAGWRVEITAVLNDGGP